MYPAIATNLKRGKGGLYVAAWDGATPPAENDMGVKVGNCESITYGPEDVQTSEKYSSTQNNTPLLLKQTDRAGWRLVAQTDEHLKDNLLLFFGATDTELTQSAVNQQVVTLSDVIVGRSYLTGFYGLSQVEVYKGSTVLTANTDYKLYADRGVIEILSGGAVVDGDDLDVDFDVSAKTYNRLAVGQLINRNVKVTYIADDQNTDGVASKDIIVIPKMAVALEGEYGLVSDDFAAMTLAFSALDDSDNYPGRGLGWLIRGAV